MRVKAVRIFHASFSLRFLLFTCILFSCCRLLVCGVSTNGVAMASLIKSLWQKIFGGRGQTAKYTFPDTLEGFGYHFNERGELVDNNGGRFQFVVRKSDPEYNQKHYEALGEVVTEYVYNLMETDLKLERVYVPVDASKGEAQSFIFRTKDAAVKDKLMVLIHGSGAVRAGQWARSLIINDNLSTGTQIPYITTAIREGFGVIVMNPNLNKVEVNGKMQTIRGSEEPEKHGLYVWRHFVLPAKARDIAIVAHSYGGIVTCTIAEEFLHDFKRRVFSVVFTDSVHSEGRELWSQPVKEFMRKRAVNFVSDSQPLNHIVQSPDPSDCLLLSAGTTKHERTSYTCMASAFEFIRHNYRTWFTSGSVLANSYVSRTYKLKSEL